MCACACACVRACVFVQSICVVKEEIENEQAWLLEADTELSKVDSTVDPNVCSHYFFFKPVEDFWRKIKKSKFFVFVVFIVLCCRTLNDGMNSIIHGQWTLQIRWPLTLTCPRIRNVSQVNIHTLYCASTNTTKGRMCEWIFFCSHCVRICWAHCNSYLESNIWRKLLRRWRPMHWKTCFLSIDFRTSRIN